MTPCGTDSRRSEPPFEREDRFLDDVASHGVRAALASARRDHYQPDQRALNELAYQFWRVYKDSASARRTFQANAAMYPASWIARGSLGEFLAASGDTVRARTETEIALRLHPRDRDLIDQLEGLRRP